MPLIYTDVPESTAIETIGYDPASQQLTIQFRKRKSYPEYVWGGVPSEFAGNFLLSRSKGRFYHDFLKGDDFYRVKPTFSSYKIGAIKKRIERAAKKVAATARVASKVARAARGAP